MLEEDQSKAMEEVHTKGDQEPLDQVMEDDMVIVATSSREFPQGRDRWLIKESNDEGPVEDLDEVMCDVSSQESYYGGSSNC